MKHVSKLSKTYIVYFFLPKIAICLSYLLEHIRFHDLGKSKWFLNPSFLIMKAAFMFKVFRIYIWKFNLFKSFDRSKSVANFIKLFRDYYWKLNSLQRFEKINCLSELLKHSSFKYFCNFTLKKFYEIDHSSSICL